MSGGTLDSAACHAQHYKLTLILLYSMFAGLLSLLCIAFFLLHMRSLKQKPLHRESRTYVIMQQAKAGLAQALHWKPWGVKFAALLGLAVFWFDKATDLRLLVALLAGGTWTGHTLLGLFVGQYIVTAYVLIVRLAILSRNRAIQVVCVCTVLPGLLTALFAGLPVVLMLDVLLFFADFGLCMSCVTARIDLEEYQLSRDVSRSLAGTIPTVVLQSVAFTMGTNPRNDMRLTSEEFISSYVGSAAQLLKVVGQMLYVALIRSESVPCVFWRHLSAAQVFPASPKQSSLESRPSEKPMIPLADQVQLGLSHADQA